MRNVRFNLVYTAETPWNCGERLHQPERESIRAHRNCIALYFSILGAKLFSFIYLLDFDVSFSSEGIGYIVVTSKTLRNIDLRIG